MTKWGKMVTEWVKWLQNWVKWLQNWVTQKTPNMKNPNATKTLKMLQQNSPNATTKFSKCYNKILQIRSKNANTN